MLEKILKTIDTKAEGLLSNDTEETRAQICDLLSILAFPDSNDEEFISALYNSDKHQIQRLIYYCLKNFEDLKERAYLGAFLTSIDVPGEFMMDDEMLRLDRELKELQMVFQQEHQELVQLKASVPQTQNLNKDIKQLEIEREQLKLRIAAFQQKAESGDAATTKLIKELLNGTRMLRKEQEEENSLIDKLREQKYNLEYAENNYLSAQQRLLDAQKACGQEVN